MAMSASGMELIVLRASDSVDRSDVEARLARFDPALASVGGRGPFDYRRCTFEIDVAGPPLDAPALAAVVDHAPFPEATKAAARAHRSCVGVRLIASEAPWLDRCATLMSVAGALAAATDGVAVAHLAAYALLPAGALVPDGDAAERWEILRAIPLGLLITGFRKYQIEGEPGVWMATVCANTLGLPEFAMHVPDHSHGQRTLDLFDRLHRHLLSTAAVFRPGDRITVGKGRDLQLAAMPENLPFVNSGQHWLQLRT